MPRPVIGTVPTFSAADTRAFLSSHTITDDELMRELWNGFSGLPGLLDARPVGSAPRNLRRGERDFIYNPSTRRYRRVATGKLVTEAEIRRAVYKVSTEAKNRMREETKQMMAGAVLFAVWYMRTRTLLKALYRAVFIVTLGGLLFEDDAARAAFYIWAILLFDRLDQFKIAVETGAMAWNGHIIAHAGRLARSVNGAYQNAKLTIGRMKGHDEARRILGENENHCNDSDDRPGCIELAEIGWMPILAMTPIGGATCRDNCLCQLQTRKRPNA